MVAWIYDDEWETDLGLQFDIAATGFHLRGKEVRRFCDIETVYLMPDDLLYGLASHVHHLGLEQIPDYPEALASYALPKEKMPFEKARALEFPYFIKPVSHKEFSGFVARSESSLSCIEGNPEVWVGEVAEIPSEWRVYVLKGEVIRVCHYKGDPLAFPNRDLIEEMIEAWEDAPAAYAMDVSPTHLIETNDMFCLGNYGVESADFAQMLEARWAEVDR